MMMEVEYNGIPGSNFGVYAKNLPTIPPAVKKASSVEIAGRDGTLYLLDGGYESTEKNSGLTGGDRYRSGYLKGTAT